MGMFFDEWIVILIVLDNIVFLIFLVNRFLLLIFLSGWFVLIIVWLLFVVLIIMILNVFCGKLNVVIRWWWVLYVCVKVSGELWVLIFSGVLGVGMVIVMVIL